MNRPVWWQDGAHPVWRLAHIVVVTLAAMALGWMNASSFDTGEMLTALGTGAAAWLTLGRRTS